MYYSTNNNNNKKKKRQTWLCDICQTCSFPTYPEAVAHEQSCVVLVTNSSSSNPTNNTTTTANNNKKHRPHPKTKTTTTQRKSSTSRLDAFFTVRSPAEQRQVEFQAKIRLKRQKEQHKKQQQQLAKKSQTNTTIPTSFVPTMRTYECVGWWPVYHVVPTSTTTDHTKRRKPVADWYPRPPRRLELPTSLSLLQEEEEDGCSLGQLPSPTTTTIPTTLPVHSCDSYFAHGSSSSWTNPQHLPGTIQPHIREEFQQWLQEWNDHHNNNNNNYDSDEWFESDTEDGASSFPRVCGLVGPTGTGKSQLVYELCPYVLELHPGDKRNASSLRKHLQEATQSHSIHPNNPQLSQNKHKHTPNDDATTTTRTVILLDEVDNVFEQDTGFWNTLHEICRHTKCPIVWTANRENVVLHKNNYCRILYTQRPSPSECAQRLWNILQHEHCHVRCGSSWQKMEPFQESDVTTEAYQSLYRLSELYDGDLRKLVNQLQVSLLPVDDHHQQPRNMDHNDDTDLTLTASPEGVPSSQTCNLLFSAVMEHVHPHSVDPSENTVVTITGKNFLSLVHCGSLLDPSSKSQGYPVTVKIDHQISPMARIMDDSTVLAMIPRRKNFDTNPFGLMPGSTRESLSLRYGRLTVESQMKVGMLSQTGSTVRARQLVDGERLSELEASHHIEFQYARAPSLNEIDKISQSTPFVESEEAIREAFRVAVEAWLSRNSEVPSIPKEEGPLGIIDRLSSDEMEGLSTLASDVSDAAYLDDLDQSSTPYLAGSCRGYGFEFVRGYNASSNESSKRPNEESLILSGAKDSCFFYGSSEAYMNAQAALFDRRMMRRVESLFRGSNEFEFRPFEPAENEEDLKLLSSSYMDEEDGFLVNGTPAWFDELISLLGKDSRSRFDCKLFDHRMFKQLDRTVSYVRDLAFLFTPAQVSVFPRWLVRLQESLNPTGDLVDRRIFLDYAPILRIMAMHERAHDVAFAKSIVEDQFGPTRVTRRSRQIRKHHFQRLIPPSLWEDENDESRKIVNEFATTTLVYDR